MRVVSFCLDNTTAVGYSAGIGILSDVLRAAGCETKLLHVSDELGFPRWRAVWKRAYLFAGHRTKRCEMAREEKGIHMFSTDGTWMF